MRRLVALAALAGLLLNGLAIWLGRGSFVHTIGVIAIAAYVGLPALIAGILFYALRSRYGRARTIGIAAWTVSIVALSGLLSLWPGRALADHDVAEAKAYCEQLAARLDALRQQTGRYPADLSTLRAAAVEPRLVRESLSYSSGADGATFELAFTDPRQLMTGLAYHSGDRRWVDWD